MVLWLISRLFEFSRITLTDQNSFSFNFYFSLIRSPTESKRQFLGKVCVLHPHVWMISFIWYGKEKHPTGGAKGRAYLGPVSVCSISSAPWRISLSTQVCLPFHVSSICCYYLGRCYSMATVFWIKLNESAKVQSDKIKMKSTSKKKIPGQKSTLTLAIVTGQQTTTIARHIWIYLFIIHFSFSQYKFMKKWRQQFSIPPGGKNEFLQSSPRKISFFL
jgi:hypothetical protein